MHFHGGKTSEIRRNPDFPPRRGTPPIVCHSATEMDVRIHLSAAPFKSLEISYTALRAANSMFSSRQNAHQRHILLSC
jgi:hypothetical protein